MDARRLRPSFQASYERTRNGLSDNLLAVPVVFPDSLPACASQAIASKAICIRRKTAARKNVKSAGRRRSVRFTTDSI